MGRIRRKGKFFKSGMKERVGDEKLIIISVTIEDMNAGMWSRSRGLGLETVSRTNNVSSRSRAISCRWLRRFVRRARSIVVVVPYRPICLSP